MGKNNTINYNGLAGYNNDNNIINGIANIINDTDNSIISGHSNQITQTTQSIISGMNNTVSNTDNSLIMGNHNTTAYNSLLGQNCGDNIICGQYNTCKGGDMLIIGEHNDDDGRWDGIICGNGNIYYGDGGALFLGNYNKDENKTYYFNIANGAVNDRKNCFNVSSTGQTKLRELSFYDDINDEEIISFDGYVTYSINNGQGDKNYRVISHAIVDLTTYRGYFWSSPIFLPESTSSTLGFSWAAFKNNGKTYNFNCISVLNNNQSCGCCLTSANWQGTDYVKVNALKSNNGYNWQSFQDQYYNHAWPMIQMEGIIMHLVNIT